MPILKLDHRGDVALVHIVIKWLAEHNIPAGDSLSPAFVDTDAGLIYWSACVFPKDAQAYEMETGVPAHGPMSSHRLLEKYGLDSAALEPGVVAVLQKTRMLSPPPAEIVGGA